MIDPLAEVVALLRPSARFSKLIIGAGSWSISPPDSGQPYYCVVLEGSCRIVVDGGEPLTLHTGDFGLVTAARVVTLSSSEPPASDVETMPVVLGRGEFRIGVQTGPADLRMLVGHCQFGAPDAALLVSLLPRFVQIRGEPRLLQLVELVREESRAQRPARDEVLSRLLEVLFIEALRSSSCTSPSCLARGLGDPRIAAAIRAMYERPAHAWTVANLAREASLSRSAFFERFRRVVGVAPMTHLLTWRMALAKQMLRQGKPRITDIAERVGYGSASTFSTAFTRYAGLPPTEYVRNYHDTAAAEVTGVNA